MQHAHRIAKGAASFTSAPRAGRPPVRLRTEAEARAVSDGLMDDGQGQRVLARRFPAWDRAARGEMKRANGSGAEDRAVLPSADLSACSAAGNTQTQLRAACVLLLSNRIEQGPPSHPTWARRAMIR